MYAKPIYVFRLEEEDRIVRYPPESSYYAISLIAMPAPGAGGILCFHPLQTPQTGEAPAMPATGFSCLFNAAKLSHHLQRSLPLLPMFKKDGIPVYWLLPGLHANLHALFEKMLMELNNNYAFKYELLANYLSQIIHQALKLQPEMHRLPTDGCQF
ncbi:hypothetical protein [Paraflavitalea pollutisoli]|uniref:hypothetical protein n=1 Tax=Paraflavitalea pollutisoli TaxID=3034143 RepID=UPI0023ECDAD0|nr:hypothetical protein [Paraflavitalea sp. H1-2-19X]